MTLDRRLATVESLAYKRPRPSPPAPRICVDCGGSTAPLERALQPHEPDIPRCNHCADTHALAVLAALEEAGVRPAAAIEL
jgi:hypothetical protein